MKQKAKKIFKQMLIGLGIITALVSIGGIGFMSFSAEFGGQSKDASKTKIEQSPNYKDGKFQNLGNVKMDMSFGKFRSMMKAMFNPDKNSSPDSPVDYVPISAHNLKDYKGNTRLFWLGHSTFFIQINGKNVLIDPVFGQSPSPIALFGPKRFNPDLPIQPEDLPMIDVVLISHDHYDHLDYKSITKLKDKSQRFIVPLGVKAHLLSWGIEDSRIEELDWWEEALEGEIKFTSTPAQHFSGRGKWFNDRETTLWCSYVIETADEKIFFSGDSGYGDHFKTIGEKFGSFDFAMIECGQYNKLWEEIHMLPEQSVQAGMDVNAKVIMPIHWGVFKLAMHSWTDPVERFTATAEKEQMSYMVPQIGAEILISNPALLSNKWWTK